MILIESAIPSDLSGLQSNGVASFLAALINSFSPSSQIELVKPKSLSLSPTAMFVGENEAVVGTTKLLHYSQSYEGESTNLDSGIELLPNQDIQEGKYTVSIAPTNAKSGALRLVCYEEGSFSFSLQDKGGNKQTYSFTSLSCVSPKSATFALPSTLKVGEAINLPATFSSEETIALYNGETLDHYLQRYFDVDKAAISSSDENVISYKKGVLTAVGEGEATLSFSGQAIGTITVLGTHSVPADLDMTLSMAEAEIHPLDFDYWDPASRYGQQINVTFTDGESHPVRFFSSDPLIAKVSNEHLDSDGSPIPGGFVQGYRKKGKAIITAVCLDKPSLSKTIEVTSASVLPSSASFSTQIIRSTSGEDATTLTVGDQIVITMNCEPANAEDKRIHVSANDESLVSFAGNDTGRVTITMVKSGSLSLEMSSVANPSLRDSCSVSIKAKPVISDSEFSGFAQQIRKGVGHMLLFFATGLFGTAAFALTFETRKAKWLMVPLSSSLAGFIVAGVSEWIQTIPALKRSGLWSDVGIDMIGYVGSAILVCLVFFTIWLIQKRKRKD